VRGVGVTHGETPSVQLLAGALAGTLSLSGGASFPDGMGWDGMGWDGMGWDGMGWDGMGWEDVLCVVGKAEHKIHRTRDI